MSDTVLIEKIQAKNGKCIGLLTLNDPRRLNSLSLEMIRMLYSSLKTWRNDINVTAVFLHSSGEKAFCAGGNVRNIYESLIENPEQYPNKLAETFFSEEYQLDYLIHTYPKPIIVWGSGIVMGGGVGLMAGASHRVGTENIRLAMPEIAIGLFPDVGGTWFLNRAPDGTGLFLGLTGAQINSTDARYVGLTDFAVPHERKNDVMSVLAELQWNEDNTHNHNLVTSVIKQYEQEIELPESNIKKNLVQIKQATEEASLKKIADRILNSSNTCLWWQKAVRGLENGCPTTAFLVYEQCRRGKDLDLEAVFQLELVMALQCVSRPDFREGVRALLVDKDNNPSWRYKTIDEVPEKWIEAHFQSPWKDEKSRLILEAH